MKLRFSAAVAGVGTLAAAAGIVLVGGSASATAAVPYEPDSHSVGTISFYDSAGNVQTSGHITDDAPFAAYAVGSVLPRVGDTKAKLVYAQPDPAKAETANWTVLGISALANTFPVTTAGAPPNTATTPTVQLSTSDTKLEDDIGTAPNTGGTAYADGVIGCAAGLTATACASNTYANLYQIRLLTNNASGDSSTYDTADILVDPTTLAWTQVYPTAKTATTVTTFTASPAAPAANQPITLTATETPGVAGTMAFTDGVTSLGTATNTNTSGSYSITVAANTLTAATHNLTATFTPADTATYNGSSKTLSLVVTAPKTVTTTTLNIINNTTTGQTATLSGSVSPTASGTIQFLDSGTPISPTTPAVVNVAGDGTYTATFSFAAGSHSVKASFTSSDPAFTSSASPAVNFATSAPAGTPCATSPITGCTDTQNIQGEIPPGTLSISTPYTTSNPLDIGQLALSPDSTYWTKSATFKCIIVTDSTSGGSAFTASALASPLTLSPGTSTGTQNQTNAFQTINASNVGLTGLVPSTQPLCQDGNAPVQSYVGLPTSITTHDVPALHGVVPADTSGNGLGGTTPHTILTGTGGDLGTATYDGTIQLTAPTSTQDGTYTGTIVFTVTD